MDLIFYLVIIMGIIFIFWIIWDVKLHYIYVYKKLNIGDIYEIKYDDPWLEPERIRIIGKKNKWLRIMKLKDNSCKSITNFDLVSQGYKCTYRYS